MTDPKYLFNKYLDLLEVAESEPTFEFLNIIVKAHLIRVPFENISKLLYKRQGMNNIPDFPAYLDGIDKFNFGGTCYANNYYLYLLLNHLGYNVKLCGADMQNPDVHLISMVNINGEEYIVDGGYAAPFLNPLPRDLAGDYVISLGKEKYILKPKDDRGKTKVEQYINDELLHWYTANPRPRKIDEFRKVVADSYADDAMFINVIRITRFFENGSFALKNLDFTENIGRESSTIKILRRDIPALAQEKFGMPVRIVKDAIKGINKLKAIYD